MNVGGVQSQIKYIKIINNCRNPNYTPPPTQSDTQSKKGHRKPEEDIIVELLAEKKSGPSTATLIINELLAIHEQVLEEITVLQLGIDEYFGYFSGGRTKSGI